MRPVDRWLICGLAAFVGGTALAQVAPVPAPAALEIDESKIPEWVKRQARSPYKVIIESNTARVAKPTLPKVDSTAKRPQKNVADPSTPALASAEPRTEAPLGPVAANRTSANEAKPADLAPEATNDRATVPAAASEAAALPRPEPLETETAATLSEAPRPTAEPALAAPSSSAVKDLPLTLLKGSEPAIPPELVNSRLNGANVVVAFTVKADGEVVNPSVASTSDWRLNRSVLRAVRDWRYAPIETAREHSVRFEFTTKNE